MNYELKKILNTLDEEYSIICKCSTSSTRARHAAIMYDILQANPETKEYWSYDCTKVWYTKQFTKINKAKIDVNPYYPEFKIDDNGIIKDDGINLPIPSICGIYLIGTTGYNPKLKKPYFSVKIGKSDWMPDRLNHYYMYSPYMFRIDYKQCYDNYEQEHYYQKKLAKIACGRHSRSKEWYLVDEDTYLEISAKGFKFFEK